MFRAVSTKARLAGTSAVRVPGSAPVQPSGSSAAGYRPDIDGLRAVAIISVIAFHVSHAYVPNGFLGVDIFFVISGYLIARIVLRDVAAGRFSILRFYEHRLRRIAPALLTVLAVTTVFATALLLTADLENYGKSVMAALLFVSNFYFWRDSNYFSPAADYKPLLHTWSLGVEEQFYLLLPLLLLLIAPRLPRATVWIVAVLSLLSFLLDIVAVRVGAGLPAFYLLPTRAWELGAGVILAAGMSRRTNERDGKPPHLAALWWAVSLAGAGLVVAGLFRLLDLPGFIPVALPVVVGTAMIIWAGTECRTPINRLLGLSPFVAVGLISYSLYLWHWPILVFARYYAIDGISPLVLAGLVALGFLLAAVSWKYVERPFRDRSLSTGRVVQFATAGSLVLLIASGATLLAQGFPGRLNPQAAQINAAVGTNYRCPIPAYLPFGAGRACRMSLPSGSPADADVVLLGNSHAQMYAPMVARLLADRNLNGLLVPANGCLPLIGPNISKECVETAEKNLDAVLALQNATLVVLAFNWDDRQTLVNGDGTVADAQGLEGQMQGLTATIQRLEATGKRIALIGPLAIPGYDIASLLSRSMAFGMAANIALGTPYDPFLDRYRPALSAFSSRRDITFIRPDLVQCGANWCDYLRDGSSFFSDSNHLAEASLGFFERAFAKGLDAALSGSGVPKLP